MKSPQISVLMSAYNDEFFIKDAVQSILDQTFEDFEFIIINDGSTDGTTEYLNSLTDPRLKIIHQANCGLTQSLQKGLKLAKGQYIARLDSDDIAEATRLQKQYEYMEINNNVGFVGCGYRLFNKPGVHDKKYLPPYNNEELKWTLLFKNVIPHTCAFMRSRILAKIGGYDVTVSYAQDYELYTRLCRVSNVASIDRVLVDVRWDDRDGISAIQNNHQAESISKSSCKHIEWLLGVKIHTQDRKNLIALDTGRPIEIARNEFFRTVFLYKRLAKYFNRRFYDDEVKLLYYRNTKTRQVTSRLIQVVFSKHQLLPFQRTLLFFAAYYLNFTSSISSTGREIYHSIFSANSRAWLRKKIWIFKFFSKNLN
jgi:glycosyltransferase involved in cell wall biosynthesis